MSDIPEPLKMNRKYAMQKIADMLTDPGRNDYSDEFALRIAQENGIPLDLELWREIYSRALERGAWNESNCW